MRKLKCSFQDYTEDDLPLTRKDVFFNCYKERFSVLLKLGLICLALIIPFVIVSLLKELYVTNALEALVDKTEENIASLYFGAELVFGSIKIVCYVIFAVFFAGITQILRQLFWDEPLFFGDDFKNGLKSNSLRFTVTVLILAIMNFLLNLYARNVLKYILNGIFVSVIFPVAVWYMLQGIYYKSKTLSAIKSAEILYIKNIPATLILVICTILPFWLVESFISLLIVRYAVLLVLALFYVVPLTMCWMLYACHTFDKLVNKEQNPEIYRKGMRPEFNEDVKEDDIEDTQEADEVGTQEENTDGEQKKDKEDESASVGNSG